MRRSLSLICALCAALAVAGAVRSAYAENIVTFAGPGMPVPGTQAGTQGIDRPIGVARDASGGFYVSSMHQNRVYRVAADGTLSVAAGSGTAGVGGDGGPATSAQLFRPAGIAVDGTGNLYIADLGNQRIRKVTAAGVISTVAGNGTAGFAGDGGAATSAQLYNPYGVAIDAAGNLFIADYENSRVRKVTPGGIMSTAAGSGVVNSYGDGGLATDAALIHPIAVAIDASGNLLIADYTGNKIRKVTPAGFISTMAGTGMLGWYGDGGPATAAYIYAPAGIAADSSGNVFISDSGSQCIRKVTPAGVISTVAGTGNRPGRTGDNGPATAALLSGPMGVALDTTGSLLIADYSNCLVRKVATNGVISTAAGNGSWGSSGDGAMATNALLTNPSGVAVDASGNVFIVDSVNDRVRKVSAAGVVTTVAGNGTRGFGGDGGPATSALLNTPSGITLDKSGNLFIADSGNERIRKVTPAGVISTVAGVGSSGSWIEGGLATAVRIYYAVAVTVDDAGNLYIAVSTGNWIIKVTAADGTIRTLAGGNGAGYGGDGGRATAARLLGPTGVAVDASGVVYIADTGNGLVRKVTPDGIISKVAGGGTGGDGGPAIAARLVYPHGLVFDSSGNLFVADEGTHTIRRVSSAGIISTLAGNGALGFSGDGGPATSAQLYRPTGIAVDRSGNVFVADSSNYRVRKITLEEKNYFAHVAIGEGYTTVFTLGNVGSSTLTGTVILTDQQGNPLVARGTMEGSGAGSQTSTGSSFPVSVPAGGVATLTASPVNNSDPLRSGWARVESAGGAFYGVGTFQTVSSGILQGMAGVLPSTPVLTGTIPVDDDTAANRFTGYAVANPGAIAISIGVQEVGADGRVVNTLSDIQLGPGQQKAAFFFQDPRAGKVFKGSAVLSGRNGASFAAVALVMNQNLLTAIPVISGASPSSFNTPFAHVAIGGGYSTVFTILNTGSDTLSGTLTLTGQDGNLLVASMTDGETNVTSHSFPLAIPPGGTRYITVTAVNKSDPTKAGWARVSSTGGKLGGVATFQLSGGSVLRTIAGVLSSTPTPSVTIPVSDDAGASQFTGYAVANNGNTSISIGVSEVSADGRTVTALSDIQLAPGEQKAVFLVQDPKAGQKFKGSAILVGRNGATFCAVGLVQNQGMFTAIPVTVGKAPNIN